MASVADITIIGNVGRDPETRYTPGGAMNVQFTAAVSKRFTDASGTVKETTTWFRVTAWRQLAESLDQLVQKDALKKGSQVYIRGSIEAREYQDQQGATRTSLDVTASSVLLLGKRENAGAAGNAEPDYDDVPV